MAGARAEPLDDVAPELSQEDEESLRQALISLHTGKGRTIDQVRQTITNDMQVGSGLSASITNAVANRALIAITWDMMLYLAMYRVR